MLLGVGIQAVSVGAGIVGVLFAVAVGIAGLAYKSLADARGQALDDERWERHRLEGRVDDLEETVSALQRTIVRLENELQGHRPVVPGL